MMSIVLKTMNKYPFIEQDISQQKTVTRVYRKQAPLQQQQQQLPPKYVISCDDNVDIAKLSDQQEKELILFARNPQTSQNQR